MVVLVVLLVLTNLVTLGALGYFVLRPADPARQRPDRAAAAALDRSPRPPTAAGGTRRLISIEILNPIELAGTRGRILGIAGSLAPGLTRRIVYDRTLKILRTQLVDQHVVADVRIHTLRPVPPVPPNPGDRPQSRTVFHRPRVPGGQPDGRTQLPV